MGVDVFNVTDGTKVELDRIDNVVFVMVIENFK